MASFGPVTAAQVFDPIRAALDTDRSKSASVENQAAASDRVCDPRGHARQQDLVVGGVRRQSAEIDDAAEPRSRSKHRTSSAN